MSFLTIMHNARIHFYILSKSYSWQYEVVYWPYLHPCYYINYNFAMFGLKYYLAIQWRRFRIIDLHECSSRVYLTVLLEN